jgi:uncharacterized phiE125 gp8 family phage protein
MGWQHPGAVWSAAPVTTDFLSIATLRAQLRITGQDEDVLLTGMGRAAVAHVERASNRLMVSRTCVLRLPYLPDGITAVNLPGGVVSAVSEIMVDGAAINLTGLTIIGESPAQIVPASDWPLVADEGFAVRITYIAGYAAATDCPELTAAALMVAADLFERREAQVDAGKIMDNSAVAALIGAVRIIPR